MNISKWLYKLGRHHAALGLPPMGHSAAYLHGYAYQYAMDQISDYHAN